jgi:hypothetical protein
MSRIITERITITLHTDLEKLGRFRGATCDKKEMLNDGRLLDAGQQSLTQADLTDAIREVNASAVAEVTLLRSQLESLSGLRQERDQLALQVETLQAEIDALKNPAAPQAVTPAQIRVWLVSRGISLAQTEQFIASIPDPMTREIARIKWEYGVTVLRTDPLVVAFAQALGMDEQQTDQAFEEASRL